MRAARVSVLPDEEGEWTDEQEAEYQALQAQWEAFDDLGDNMEAALREWGPRQRATSGVVLTIDNAGQLVLAEGLVRREDVPQA